MFFKGVPVAVKAFHSATEEEVKREARIISKLKNPNFPLLLGICTLSKPYLLVTSYYNISDQPCTVSSLLKSKSLSLSVHVWLTLIRQLAQAIVYLHDTGFIHRDIKGDNVLVSLLNNEHLAVLIDFGKCIHLSAAGNHVKCLTPLEQKNTTKNIIILPQRLLVVVVHLHLPVTFTLLGDWSMQLAHSLITTSFVLWAKDAAMTMPQ